MFSQLRKEELITNFVSLSLPLSLASFKPVTVDLNVNLHINVTLSKAPSNHRFDLNCKMPNSNEFKIILKL